MPERDIPDVNPATWAPWPCTYVTVDVVLLAPGENASSVLAISRANDPYRGQLALPGGFVDPDEDLETAAVRELLEETSVQLSKAAITQLGAYGEPSRDPRHRTVSVAYLAVLDRQLAVSTGDDARTASWVPLTAARAPFAFDHERILADGLAHPRASDLVWDHPKGPHPRRRD